MSAVRQREVGEVVLAGEPPVFHEALGRVCGTALPGNEGQGASEGTQVELEDREEPGESVYAGAAQAHRVSGPQGHRH